ncbi:von Willebrand factor C and EGF domain-containing protein isoform X8 [Myotis myotis]|uniref:von Willebrand factor C and EGF domain-containing protein isoform X8 n=1 Tax=Myotis myotis TaxID=51298 RepID=UPI00174E6761|nr:von Willebrand factor C and EGF domain-containing protein isoform X8 [Myotis myotis]
MWAGLLLAAAGVALLLPGAPARGYTGRKPSGHLGTERRRLGPHVCLSGFGSGCCPGWAPSMGSGHCTLPLCSFGCGRGICIAPNVCSCQDGEQGATCPEAHGPCGEYGCDLACNHGGCQEVARVCPVGFSMTETAVGIRCTDIDECLSSSCEGRCVNTEGGFVCECGPGMQLSADRHSCQDTDECLGTPCQQRCRNSIGSYTCSCRPGFHLHGNRHSCVDVNECRRPQERRVCHHACHNTVGSFLCTCRPGFRLRADRVSCEGCFHGGVIRAEGAVFSPPAENCTVCVCLAGNVSCISPECPPGPCDSPESDCCTCAPGRCYFHGRWYVDGAVFSGDGDECTTCVCQDGEVECAFTPCPELDCPREAWWLGPGQCCFTCREPAPKTGCSLDDNGAEFPVGQIWSPGDPCRWFRELQADRLRGLVPSPHPDPGTVLPGLFGRLHLHRQDLPQQPDLPVRAGPVPELHLPGTAWPVRRGTPRAAPLLTLEAEARDLRSKLGSVACSPVDCPIACSYPFHPDGQCCPVCRDCNFEGRKVGNGQVFTLDDEPCTQCTCQLGEVSCEKAPCRPACGDSATPPGDCCASCPDSPEDGRGLPPPADAALSPRRAPQDPATCSSCPGPPAAQPQRPAPHFLQLLLRTNVSNRQTLPRSHSGAQASPLPPAGPSPGPPVPPGASSLPPASPGAPATPEPSATASALPPAVLPEAPALSTADPSSPEAPATLHGLAPAASGLSAARVATTSPGTPQPPPRTASEEESAG